MPQIRLARILVRRLQESNTTEPQEVRLWPGSPEIVDLLNLEIMKSVVQ